jgi:cell division protein FtsB
MTLVKKIVYFGFIIICLFIIYDLVHSIYHLWQKNELLERRQQAFLVEKRKNAEFKSKLSVVTAPEFIEEEARNKLFLVKPGEGIVVVAPTVFVQASRSASVKRDTRPYWKQWVETFF